MSMSCAWQRAQQGACSIPKNLHPDADEEKGGKPKNDAHATFADDRSEATGEAVAKVDAHCHERRGNYRGENREKVGAKWAGLVCTEGDGDGNRSRADRERQGQRIKRASRNILQVHFLLSFTGAVHLLLAFQECPSVGNDNEAATDLHDRNGDSKETKNVRAHEKGGNQENETVDGDLAREDSAGGGRIVAGQCKKNRAAAQRIHDGKKRAEDQQGALSNFKHKIPLSRRIF